MYVDAARKTGISGPIATNFDRLQSRHVDLYGVHMSPISTPLSRFIHQAAYLRMDVHICASVSHFVRGRSQVLTFASLCSAMFLYRQ